jgi:NADPH:quinone reductase-like Zn-dependent oxidoreductase
MTKYKSVTATKRGGPEVLQVIENELRPPRVREARIKVLAAGIGRKDVVYRYGASPLAPRPPFVPGYEILGVVDAVGEGVTDVATGDRVAALTGSGGYAEFIYLGAEHLVPMPATLDPAEAVTLVLNYVTAYQMLHRTAQVKAGDKALMIGASGGVGTALLELGRLAGLTLYGTASQGKHHVLTELGAVPIDYRTQDFVDVIRKAEPTGLDFVFNGMGAEYSSRALAVLHRGGKLVEYAPPASFSGLLFGLVKLAWLNLLPNGKSAAFYGISALYARDKRPFKEDLPKLCKLLEERRIRSIVAARFPILEAAQANALLESGAVTGNVVLLAPELSEGHQGNRSSQEQR